MNASESFTFAQRESLEFELAMAGTGTLRGVLLAVRPDGTPLAIITSTQTNHLARMTRVDQRLLRIILNWPSWMESQAILHMLCAPTDEINSFSRYNQLSLAHYSKPTSLHYQPELKEYAGWRSLHVASWRIVEGEPQMKALAHPYDHALPAAAHDFGFSAADVTSALVLPHTTPRRSQRAGALQEQLLPLSQNTPPRVKPAQEVGTSTAPASPPIAALPIMQAEPAVISNTVIQQAWYQRSQADNHLSETINGLLKAWHMALPDLPLETWQIWQEHWLFNQGRAISEIAIERSHKNWKRELQQQPWLVELIRQHTAQLLSTPHKEKALHWLNMQME